MAEDTKEQTPPVSPPVTISPAFTDETENTRCEWFINDMSFCNKTKKNVKCGGDVSNCPFCR
jgi:hypothetical protein